MPIGKRRLSSSPQADKDWQALDSGPKMYNDAQLKNFHDKIQRFKVEKVQTSGETLLVLNWDEMAVAFGAYTRLILPNGHKYYRAAGGPEGVTSRFAVLANLWGQYQDWGQKQDWIAQKRLDDYAQMAG